MDRIPKLLSQYLPADLHQPLHIGIWHTRGSLAARRMLTASPGATSLAGFTGCPFTSMRPRRMAWLASVRVL